MFKIKFTCIALHYTYVICLKKDKNSRIVCFFILNKNSWIIDTLKSLLFTIFFKYQWDFFFFLHTCNNACKPKSCTVWFRAVQDLETDPEMHCKMHFCITAFKKSLLLTVFVIWLHIIVFIVLFSEKLNKNEFMLKTSTNTENLFYIWI